MQKIAPNLSNLVGSMVNIFKKDISITDGCQWRIGRSCSDASLQHPSTI